MLDEKNLIEISVCTDCLFYLVNGDIPEHNELFPKWKVEVVEENLKNIEALSMGISTDNCDHKDLNDPKIEDAHQENCVDRGFMDWSQCASCDTWLAGERMWFTGYLKEEK